MALYGLCHSPTPAAVSRLEDSAADIAWRANSPQSRRNARHLGGVEYFLLAGKIVIKKYDLMSINYAIFA